MKNEHAWGRERVCQRSQNGQVVRFHRPVAQRSHVVSLGSGIHVGRQGSVRTSAAAMRMACQL